MWPTERDQAKRLAYFWHQHAECGAAEDEELDADLRETVLRLDDLWTAPKLAPEFVTRLGEELRKEALGNDTQGLVGGSSSTETRYAAGAVWPGWLPRLSEAKHLMMGQAARNAAMAVLLLLVIGLGGAAYNLRPSSHRQTTQPVSGMSGQIHESVSSSVTAPNSSYTLYAAPDGKPFARLDPATLANLPVAPLDFGEPYPNWVVSADGTVSARSEAVGDSRVIVIRSGLSGPVRRRIVPTTQVFVQALSRDGSRLLTQTQMGCSPSGCSAPVWYVYDTTNGRLVSTFTGDDQSIGGMAFLDPTGRRLYEPAFATDGRAVGPWPLQIVAYDLTAISGREIGRLTLPTVPAGIWYDRTIDQVPVEESLTPAIALSPDGRTMAVVHADTNALTLIDAATLRVERTMPLTRPASLGGRLLAWLGLVPQPAAAKFMNGISLEAVFATDGRTLYLYGTEGTVGNTKTDVREQGLGLRAIDPATGVIVGEALAGQELDTVLPAPDGHSVYASGPTVPWEAATGEPPYRLVRLTPRSLEVLAKRDFPDRRWVALVPTAP